MNIELWQNPDIAQLKPIWQELQDASPVDSIFGSYFWNNTWWKIFGAEQKKPFFLICKKAGNIIGFIPLFFDIEKWGSLNVRVLKPVGLYTADYIDLMMPSGDNHWASVFIDFLTHEQKWDVLSLMRLPNGSRNAHSIKQASETKNINVVEEPEETCPYLELKGTFDLYMVSRFRSKFRNRIRRMQKRLHRIGRHRFEMITDPSGVEVYLPKLAKLEKRSWKGSMGLGIFNTPDRLQFFTQIAHQLSFQGKTALHLQWLDDRLVSYHYGFISNRRFYDYNLAFDPEFEKYSPGLLSMVDLLNQCYEMNLSFFDFLRGGECYKALWTNKATQNINLHIFTPTTKGSFLAAGLSTRLIFRRIKRRLLPKKNEAPFSITSRPDT